MVSKVEMMQKWEYLQLSLRFTCGSTQLDQLSDDVALDNKYFAMFYVQMEKGGMFFLQLNRLGEIGWELITIHDDLAYFKRPINE